MMSYILGIDLGIASVGFALVDDKNHKILRSGVHLFEAAENPKTGASLAEPRRTKRGLRRVLHRRATRKRLIKQILRDHGFENPNVIHTPLTQKLSTYDPARFGPDNKEPVTVWNFRQEALTRKLTDEEFMRILFQIAKRRGFQSNRKSGSSNDVEGKKALSGGKALQEDMARSGARTIGAYLATKDKKRNGDGSYENFVERDLLRTEIKLIFQHQRALGFDKASPELEAAFAHAAFYQRPLQSSDHLIGFCTLEPQEKRAPKFAYSAELFVLWSRLNNLRIKVRNGEERPLTLDEKNRMAEKVHALKSFSLKQARKELKLEDEERFNISYRKISDTQTTWEKIRDDAENKSVLALNGYHTLKDALDTGSPMDWQHFITTKRDVMNQIAFILSVHEDEEKIKTGLLACGCDAAQIAALSGITHFSKTLDLSLKAINAILPFMQQGLTYDKACLEAGYDHSRTENKGLDQLPPFEDVRNPVVNRALAQVRKVINAVLREHGKPHTFIIELAREFGKTFKDRKDIEREQKKNEANRQEAKTHIAELLGLLPDNVSGEDILRYRLWKEQEGLCPYSSNYISPETLKDPTATQIDHILPYSRSWNDSYMNKVLCLTSENQNKGNATPREYFARQGLSIEALESIARRLPRKKAENLLMEQFDLEKEDQWKSRAINDMRYMARLLKSHIEQSLHLGTGNRVQARNGALTAHLRGGWGFPDKNRRNDRHHALDAIVMACSTQAMVQIFTTFNKYEARKKNPSERPVPPKPWPTFYEDAKAAIEQVFVSRMPVRRVTGPAHQETIRRIRFTEDGTRQIIQRVKLKDLTASMLENMVDKNGRGKVLYSLVKARMDAHKNDAKKAFAEPLFMPVKDKAKTPPPIHAVRILTTEKTGLVINHGLASNGDMVRVDVFKKDGKFLLVPIYVHHFAKKTLPDRAVIGGKPEEVWPLVDDRDFLFSLYPNDYVKLIGNSGVIEGYYTAFDRSTAALTLKAHDRDPAIGKDGILRSLGVKTQQDVQKFSVDYFGRTYRIMKEVRLGLAHGSGSKRR